MRQDLPIFYNDWWLDLVCSGGEWDVALSEDGSGKIRGIFPYFRQKIKGISMLSNPVLTPYLGIMLFFPDNQQSKTARYSFEQRVIRELEEQIPDKVWYKNISFSPAFTNWLPFYWKGYQQMLRYTYRLDRIQDTEFLSSQLSNGLKRQLKKARNSHEIMDGATIASLYALQKASLTRQGLKTPFSEELLKRLYQELEERNMGELIFASALNDPKAKAEAGMLLVYDKQCAYCLVLGMEDNGQGHDASKLVLWESIQRAARRVNCYDFEGSMVEGVERVYRSFGSTRHSYYTIIWYRNKWVRAFFSLMNK